MFFVPIEKDNPTENTPWMTYILILVNSMIFIISFFYYGQYEFEYTLRTYGFIPSSPQFITAVSSMFLHAGIIHVLGNMFFLWMYGDNVEDILGPIPFLTIYLIVGLIATYIYYMLTISSIIPLVGASGAISGVLGIYMIMFPYAHIDFNIQLREYTLYAFHFTAKKSMYFWFSSQLLLGIIYVEQIGGIAFSAHIGGFIAGVIIAYILKKYFDFIPKPPTKALLFKRYRIEKIWCPYCGYEETSTEFKTYICQECGTKYQIISAELHADD